MRILISVLTRFKLKLVYLSSAGEAMIFDVSVALTWIMFIALFAMSFFWLRAAWRILIRRDFSEVALKRGVSPANPEKFAPYALLINLLGGSILVVVIVSILFGQIDYDSWTALAGITIWCKLIANFILSRHAHPGASNKKEA
jgi:hypothetical protein